MSLTSLADAPLLPKPAITAGSSLPRSSSLPLTKIKEDQAAIDALFQEDIGLQAEKSLADRKSISPSMEPSHSARKFDLKSNPVDAVSLPSLLPASQPASDTFKKREPKQTDNLFSKTRDASDVLAGFLADTTIDMNINKRALSQDVNKDQREDLKSKWNSHSPQPLGRLPTLTFSPRPASGSMLTTPESLEPSISPAKPTSNSQPSISPAKPTSNSLTFLKQDRKWDTKEDVLSLLPDDSNKASNSRSDSLSYAATTFCKNVDEEISDFGGYQPSCLSMPAPKHTVQRRHLTSFFPSSETEKETKTAGDKREKGHPLSTMVDNVSHPPSIVVDNLSRPPRMVMDNLSDQVEMLKKMHTLELKRRDKQLCMERELVTEKRGAMESFSQLLLKADEWSAKIDELHKRKVCEKIPQPAERLDWIANIESAVSDHESSLKVIEKRSTEVCNQLEKVAVMIGKARKDMEILQKQEDQRISRSNNQSHACQEKKDLEIERETLLCMREQISQADATLQKQLHEHALHMQTEAEEMAMQKRELEHAKRIAADIAVEVENSRRELDLYNTTLNKSISKVQGKEPCIKEDPLGAYMAPQRLAEVGRKLRLSSRYELHRRPYSSAGVHRNTFLGMDVLDTSKSLGSDEAMMQGVQEGMYYLRAQEEFLIQAERALEGMCFNDVCVPLASF